MDDPNEQNPWDSGYYSDDSRDIEAETDKELIEDEKRDFKND